MLLDQLDGVSSGQYEIRQVPDRQQAAKEAMENLTPYATYPVDPTRSNWLQELLERLQQEGVIPLGPYQPALQVTELYFQTLA